MSKDNLLEAMIARLQSDKKPTDKKQKIAEAAVQLFAEKGYANTSTSEIAKRAGVAEGTIFRHYGTKENLLLSILLPFLKESLPGMAESVFREISSQGMDSLEDFFRALLKNRYQFFKENREIFQVFIKELLYNENFRNEIVPHFTENVFQRIRQTIVHFQERGEIRDLPAQSLARTIFTFVFSFFVSRFVLMPENAFLDDETELENFVQIVLHGIKKGN
ncbi:TetR/AcrR family transcriptional regulator [Caldibacillus debilis]|uniref:HTH tetR-type domain-containing protein n=1 Tax=Caldibacillus debilis TaxID=301148 RepID=A0A150M917_9BACI|nr:TetR/AcrR family transcriptional regulator [Caldibacillus debilis]KYD20998.1 hypothetical protein B4135_1722 [Caldibacillus debilis]